MNRKGWGLFIAVISVFILLGAGHITAGEQEVPEEIELDSDVYKTNRRGPVTFTHLDHTEDYEVGCKECHHEYKDGKNVWEEGDPVKKCAACHDPNRNQGNVKKLSIAYHKNCKTCHRNLVQRGDSEDAPYRKCTDCHEKK
ncbi:cytochrome c3 family protein [Thermodesulfobacteriota bacterium]